MLSIAGQINLLALNATIEAARALPRPARLGWVGQVKEAGRWRRPSISGLMLRAAGSRKRQGSGPH
jgi:hypothetical protein